MASRSRPSLSFRIPSLLFLLLIACPALTTSAGDSRSLLEKAFACVQGKDYATARRLYGEVLDEDPGNPEALYRMGILAFLEKDYAGAASYHERSVNADPGRQDAWKRLGDAYDKLGRHREAAESYGRACQVEYQRPLKEKEGVAWSSARELDKAGKIFESLILDDPGDYHAVYYLGNVLLAQGDTARAERCYLAAIRLRPELVEAYVNLAAVRFGQGRHAEAAELLEKTFQVSPRSAPVDPAVRLNLGVAYLKVPDPEKAKAHLQKYLDLCPACAQAEEVRKWVRKLEAESTSSQKGSQTAP
ncbi:MAG: tetratricopeptide repeat protein [bacterium]